MYYIKTDTTWKLIREKSVLFKNSTYPIKELPEGFWNANRMQAATVPVYDAATHKLTGPQEIGGGFVGYVVEPLPATDLEARREQNVLQCADAARQLIDSQLDPAGLFLVRDLVAVGSQKAAATEGWVNTVYAEAEYRKALIYADMWPDDQDFNDFSSFGGKPHTIAELMAER